MEYKTLLDKPPDYEKVRLGKEFISMYLFLNCTNKHRENVSVSTPRSMKTQSNQYITLKNKKEITDTVNLITEYLAIKQQHEKILSRFIDIDDIKSDLNYNNEKPNKKYETPINKNKIKKKTINKKHVNAITYSNNDIFVNNEIIEELKNIDEELRASIHSDENGVLHNENGNTATTICTNCGKRVPKTMLCLYCGSPILFHMT